MQPAAQRGDAPVGALGLKMLHDAPSFINVRAAGDSDCYPDGGGDGEAAPDTVR